MNWETIHSYAEELELWTSLGINIWLITGAIVFLIVHAKQKALPLEKQFAKAFSRSAEVTLIFLVALAFAFALALLTPYLEDVWNREFHKAFGI